jgi:Bifunctional DNA primase/polymerase, N-terminal
VSERTAREWALRYAAFGWRVYPVRRGGKHPLYDGWLEDATTDPERIRRTWHGDLREPNVGLVAGEAFDVVDVEAKHLEAFRRAVDANGLPDCPMARSGRDGILYVACAGTGTHRLLLDGVHIGEWKASGGVIAPPSATVGPYAWLRSPLDHPVPGAPDWLHGLVVVGDAAGKGASEAGVRAARSLTPSRAVALAHGLYRVVAEAKEGERNRLLFWASCRAAEHGLEPSAAADILLAAARQSGLSDREARLTIASGFER